MHFEQPGKQFWPEEHNFYLPVPRALLPLWFKLFEYFNCAFNKGLDNAIIPLWFKLFEYFNCAFNKGLDNAIILQWQFFFLWKSGA